VKKKLFLSAVMVLAVVMIFSLSLAGCKTTTVAETTAAATTVAETTAAPETTAAAETTVAAMKPPVVGITSGSSGTVWRDKMIQDLKLVGDEYKTAGIIADYKIVNNVTNGDATEQANIIRDFISSDADIILVNPNSGDALNGVIKEATDAGILVVVFDSQVTAPGILNVTNNHYEWVKPLAKATFELLGGKGDIVNISGLEGHPANVNFDRGFYDALKEYPYQSSLRIL